MVLTHLAGLASQFLIGILSAIYPIYYIVIHSFPFDSLMNEIGVMMLGLFSLINFLFVLKDVLYESFTDEGSDLRLAFKFYRQYKDEKAKARKTETALSTSVRTRKSATCDPVLMRRTCPSEPGRSNQAAGLP